MHHCGAATIDGASTLSNSAAPPQTAPHSETQIAYIAAAICSRLLILNNSTAPCRAIYSLLASTPQRLGHQQRRPADGHYGVLAENAPQCAHPLRRTAGLLVSNVANNVALHGAFTALCTSGMRRDLKTPTSCRQQPPSASIARLRRLW